MLIIGITGTSGAGKGTISDYFVKNKNFRHYSVSGFLKEKVQEKDQEPNRDNLREMANEIRKKYSPDYIIKKLFEKAKKENKNAVIESIRNPKEVDFIKASGGIVLAVDANVKTRYKRIKLRSSEKDNVTFDEFQTQDKKELKNTNPNAQNILKCIEMADYLIINEGSFKDLYDEIEKIISQFK